jgi:hypothetical protein
VGILILETSTEKLLKDIFQPEMRNINIVRQSLYFDSDVHKVLYTLTLLANSILPPPPLPVLPVTEDNNPKIGFI